MHKAIDFLKKEPINNNKKNIIFLDIDGVIQPYNNQYRFNYDMKKTVEFLDQKYSTDIYSKTDIYDVCAAYYDWDEIALGMIKKILFHCNAYIVIHSGWKESLDLKQLKALFRLYGLNDYVIDVCEKGTKEKVIKKYLEENKDNIEEYVIVDDQDMTNTFGYHFVKTKNVLSINNYSQIMKILNYEYTFDFIEGFMTFRKNQKKILDIEYKIKEISEEKVVNFRINNLENIYDTEYNIAISEFIKFISNNTDAIAVASIAHKNKEYFDYLQKDILMKHEYKEDNFSYYIGIDESTFKSVNFYNDNRGKIIFENINFNKY